MYMVFTKFDNSTNWVEGVLDNYRFEAKLYDDGSIFGIDDGRVSKLSICGEDIIVHYDRGWDIEPKTDKDREIFELVLEFLESSPRRFDNECYNRND